MNKRDHVINAALLAVGLGVALDPALDRGTVATVGAVSVPVVLGALFPDLDTAFGSHRKTFHNLLTLGVFAAFPLLFDNLHLVWVGIVTHYALDLCGNVRGMAVLYPWPEEYDVPVGVTVGSKWATAVTLAVTAAELAVIAAWLHGDAVLQAVGYGGLLAV
jgi:hypothetical protein